MERHLVHSRYEFILSSFPGTTDTQLHGYTVDLSAARQICEAHASAQLDWVRAGEHLWAAYSATRGYYLIFVSPNTDSKR